MMMVTRELLRKRNPQVTIPTWNELVPFCLWLLLGAYGRWLRGRKLMFDLRRCAPQMSTFCIQITRTSAHVVVNPQTWHEPCPIHRWIGMNRAIGRANQENERELRCWGVCEPAPTKRWVSPYQRTVPMEWAFLKLVMIDSRLAISERASSPSLHPAAS